MVTEGISIICRLCIPFLRCALSDFKKTTVNIEKGGSKEPPFRSRMFYYSTEIGAAETTTLVTVEYLV